ncbi:IPT/TIG domain-containing protein [Actinoplanes sp. NPDC049802]|uniref:IPT/TIG domain-containing protein n=1 Tax=Actinoplanes sp. NPDC049802 TaxID=3154742 RepID=UPI0033D70D32
MPTVRKKTLVRALGGGTASVAAAALALVATTAPAHAATANPISGPIGATLRLNDASISGLGSGVVPAVQFRPDSCPANWTTPTTTIVNATTVTRNAGEISVVVPTVPLGTNNVAKTYNVCVYQSAITTATQLAGAHGVFTVYAPATSSPPNGPSGGGTTLTVTSPNAVFTGLGSVGGLFVAQPAGCPATNSGGIPANVIKSTSTANANTVVTVPVPPGVVGTMIYNLCLYAGTTSNDALLTAATYGVALPSVMLSATSGPYDSPNGITINSGTYNMLGGVSAPGVLFVTGPQCPINYGTGTGIIGVNPTSIRRLAQNRMAVTVPGLPLAPQRQPQQYQLCVYNGTSPESTVLAQAGYTSTILPTLGGVTPEAGPTTGGVTVTVTGSDFPTAPGSITASLGGTELTNVTPINSTSFTATLPPHGADDNATLMVTTPSGTKALPGAFAFRDAIKVSPNTAPNTMPAIDVSITGNGFFGYPFGTSGTDARIFLTRGEYNGAQIAPDVRSNSPVAECGNVLVIGDNELICTLKLNRRLNKDLTGFVDPTTAPRTLTLDITTVAGSRVVTSKTSAFTIDDIGHNIVDSTGLTIPNGSIITDVLSPAKAVISAPALLTAAPASEVTVAIGGAVRNVNTTGSNGLIAVPGSTTVSVSGSTFTKADVGRVFKDTPGVTDGTTIVSVAPNGRTAVLSAPATGGGANVVSLTGLSFTQGQKTVPGSFTAADVGAVVGANNAGIPFGTVIESLDGSSAVLSNQPGQTVTGTGTMTLTRRSVMSLYPATPVLEGAYNLTIVSNGSVDAETKDPEYRQSAVTSGSTFTVSSF